MKDLLKHLGEFFAKSEEFNRQMTNFVNAKSTPEWAFFITLLRSIQGVMANDMLTKRFAELSPEEKDITNRTYYHVNMLIEFLMNPYGQRKKRVGHGANVNAKKSVTDT